MPYFGGEGAELDHQGPRKRLSGEMDVSILPNPGGVHPPDLGGEGPELDLQEWFRVGPGPTSTLHVLSCHTLGF